MQLAANTGCWGRYVLFSYEDELLSQYSTMGWLLWGAVVLRIAALPWTLPEKLCLVATDINGGSGRNFVNACHASLFKTSNSGYSDLCPENTRNFYNDEVTNTVLSFLFSLSVPSWQLTFLSCICRASCPDNVDLYDMSYSSLIIQISYVVNLLLGSPLC